VLLTYIGDMVWTPCSSSEAPKSLDLSGSSDGKGRDGENVLWRTF